MNEATIFDMQRNSFTDGPGIRTTVFFKGCNLRCAWCHNPESQQAEAEWLLKPAQCTGCGRCVDVRAENPDFLCPNGARTGCGRRYTVAKLWEEIGKDRLFYDASGGGVTFSGGECMLRLDFLETILKRCKAEGIHTAVDTAGHVPYEAFERILPYTDLILYDVKCMDPVTHEQYTGVSNERILENLRRLLKTDTPLWIRIPIIPSVNDTEEEMRMLRDFLHSYGDPERIELLPYHALGEHKYQALGRTATPFATPTEEHIARLRAVFS